MRRYLIKNNVFEPVMSAFFDNGDRYNLFNSSVLDMFNYIRKEGMHNLIEHLVRNFGERLVEFEHMIAVKNLCTRFLQLNEPEAAAAAAAAVNAVADVLAGEGGEVSSHPSEPHGMMHGRTFVFSSSGDPLGDNIGASMSMRRKRRDEREMDEHEEDYFASDGADDMDSVEDVLDMIDQELAAVAAAGEAEEGGYSGAAMTPAEPWSAIGPDLGRRKRSSEPEEEEEGTSGHASSSENNAGTLRPRQRIIVSAGSSEPVGDIGKRRAPAQDEAIPTAATGNGSDGGGWRLVGYEDEEEGSDPQQKPPAAAAVGTKSIKLGPGDSPGRTRQ